MFHFFSPLGSLSIHRDGRRPAYSIFFKRVYARGEFECFIFEGYLSFKPVGAVREPHLRRALSFLCDLCVEIFSLFTDHLRHRREFFQIGMRKKQ
jgi:hypothetical protein